ncbi:hypothetical protein BCR39DRAFT_583419 [Naematelia encephala]|uniref:Fanconi-associated nuclease n=1 Tax=Naematelia encephala TaxID=71784 RepID=A0A1Y2ALJ0_9TREE|nr:hypothetical protein BCR39DRAFT_583419 [Naematelia encephala]
MNSSPPPPSFTLPPLNSSGQFPITPSPSPTSEKDGLPFGSASQETQVEGGTEGRVSMYVRLFEDGPKYLLTRLLLRRQGKIHPFSALSITYSPELGEEGVKCSMRDLSGLLDIPSDLTQGEEDDTPEVEAGPSRTPLSARTTYPTPSSIKAKVVSAEYRDKGKAKGKGKGKRRPWADLETGLSAAEEKADPDLAEAIRESLWASRVDRIELDDEGTVVSTPPPERPMSSRSTSLSTASDKGGVDSPRLDAFSEEFSLTPKPPPRIHALARDHSDMNLEEIMSCIPADELRRLARSRQVPLARLGNREACIQALKAVANKQTVLGFTPLKKNHKGGSQARLPFSPSGRITSESLLVADLLPHLGHAAIQLSMPLHNLISRVNLIYSRTPPPTSAGASLMLPSILVTSHKRRYPDYGPPTRSHIWADRGELLEWERATYWEVLVGDALGDNWADLKSGLRQGGMGLNQNGKILGRTEGAQVVKRIWEGVWPIWKKMVAEDSREGRGVAGDRFQTCHVLTRIVYKGAVALGILHEYDLECMVLQELLAQRRWRRGKRGAWYDRLALVLMNHYNASPEEKEQKLREATQVCIDGLLDGDTHLIYRPALSRRLTRLENKLELPSDERHISYAQLLTCETRELVAQRVPENLGQPKIKGRSSSSSIRPTASRGDREDREASLGLDDGDVTSRGGIQQTGKSVWVGKEGEVTVEGWVLEWWEARGYKGFHSEGSILTTLFALLLWPVLYHPLPGAFETPYQTAPLDLGEDTFAPSRADIFEARLAELCSTTRALELLRETDARERPRGTWAVGVNWEYGAQDLEEILECMGGIGIEGVARMLGEEYRHRVSGVPDLIVWDYEKMDVRFVEVKGPGDSLSETQKIWIDVLLSAGIQVEVCRVRTSDSIEVDTKGKKRKSSSDEIKSITAKPVKLIKQSSVKLNNGWNKVKHRARASLDEDEVECIDEEDEGWQKKEETKYESGGEEEEGHWEEEEKRIKLRRRY